jgi:hypothetical protein
MWLAKMHFQVESISCGKFKCIFQFRVYPVVSLNVFLR